MRYYKNEPNIKSHIAHINISKVSKDRKPEFFELSPW